ncbi:hypothetical protein RHMOL_Rhmol05G0102200 [Rhododendron molle]|uniref:Uncharacterized protein n=1 Tax=Rhododendron molle TaxID=49168 RepID=A0ACC0NMK7_RHOML|nr:hypothetical protein RHMOL_Rhmol05G0102200 [Rhododendron molle]
MGEEEEDEMEKDLSNIGLTGELSESIDNLTAIRSIHLGGNKLSGPLPNMDSLKALETLHLEGNQFEGPIPESLGGLPQLHELFLENNKLNGTVPESLAEKVGINLQLSPGNHLSRVA